MAIKIGSVSAKITADTSSFDRSVRNVRRKGSKLGSNLQSRFSSIGQSMQRLGMNATQYISLPIAAAFGGAVFAAGNFEEAMVEVQKVTNETTADALSESIKEMSEVIPIARTELAGIAADAARFGVRGVDNIEAFTTAVSKMAVATDLSAGRAGQAFAKLSTLLDVPVQEAENLGSAINEVSNNVAASASEIVDSLLRSGAAASQFGLTAQEITGVSGALNAVSESSQRAGSRLRRLFQVLTDPNKIEDVAGAIGLTAEEFENLREESPRRALLALVEAMAEGGREAENLKGVLTTVTRQALSGLAKNMQGVTDAIGLSTKAYKDNVSLQKEFAAASDTLFSKVTLLWNRVKNLAGGFGEILIPAVEKAITVIGDIADSIDGWSKSTKTAVAVIAGLLGASGPIILALGVLTTAFAAISWPVVLGVAAFAGAATAIASNWESVVSYFTSGEGAQLWDTVKTSAKQLWESLKDTFKTIARVIGTIWAAFGDDIIAGIKNTVTITVQNIRTILAVFNQIVDVLSGRWLTDWEGFLDDTESRFLTVFGKGGSIRTTLASLIEYVAGTSSLIGYQLRTILRGYESIKKLFSSKTEDFTAPTREGLGVLQNQFLETKQKGQGLFTNLFALPKAPEVPKVPIPKPEDEIIQPDIDFSHVPPIRPEIMPQAPKSEIIWDLPSINSLMSGVNQSLGKKLKLPKKSVGFFKQQISNLQKKANQATSTEQWVAVQQQITATKGKIRQITGQAKQSSRIMQMVGRGMSRAFSQAIMTGKSLSDTLSRLTQQLASSILQKGLMTLLTGGASAGAGLLGNIFGGIFHSGGIVGGTGDQPIIAKSGEGVFTQGQMKALGMMAQSPDNSGGQSMQKAFERALKNTVTEVSPSRVFELNEKGKIGA